MKQTLYQLLAVAPEASNDEIAEAYQAAIAKLETSGMDDPNRRVALREAFQILSNAQRRRAYDVSLVKPVYAGGGHDAEAGNGGDRAWVKWLVLGMIVIAVFSWWKMRKVRKTAEPQAQVRVLEPVSMNVTRDEASETSGPVSTEELYARLADSVARIDVQDASGATVATGSGVAIGGSSVITNCHVVRSGSQFQVKIAKQSYPASVDVMDGQFDLCRLSVSGLARSSVPFGSVSALKVGQKVYAIGAPHGLDLTISDGIVSSLREVSDGTVIQTTAPVSPGSSGGGLFDASGRLVGIVTFQHQYGQNLNFAVPVDWIGQMRARSPSQGIGRMTMPEQSTPSNPPVASNASSGDPMKEQLMGIWQCFSAVTGRVSEITFMKNGKILWVIEGKSYVGYFSYSNKKITFSGSNSVSATIDELTDNKMILNGGDGMRLACSRQ